MTARPHCEYGDGCDAPAAGTYTVRATSRGRAVHTRLCAKHHAHVEAHGIRGEWSEDAAEIETAARRVLATTPWLGRSLGLLVADVVRGTLPTPSEVDAMAEVARG